MICAAQHNDAHSKLADQRKGVSTSRLAGRSFKRFKISDAGPVPRSAAVFDCVPSLHFANTLPPEALTVSALTKA